MLVLSRKLGQKLVVNETVVVTVTAIQGRRVRLGIEAPANVPVHRGEFMQMLNTSFEGDAHMKPIRIPRIRPVSWKITVEGRENADYVRRLLQTERVQTTEPQEEPSLTEPPLYAFVAHCELDAPFTKEELAAILHQDERIELCIDVGR